VSASWPHVTLKEVTSKIGSGATPRGGNNAYKDTGIALIRSLNVHDMDFREKNLAHIDDKQAARLSNVELQEGDVLLNITGASIARCCVVPKEYLPARVNQHVSIIRPDPARLSPPFLAYLLTAPEYKDQLLHQGLSAGSTRQALTKAQLQGFEVPIPSLSEQERIVRLLDETFTHIDQAEQNYRDCAFEAENLFDRVLSGSFEGLESVASQPLSDLCTRITVGYVGPMVAEYRSDGIPFLRSQNVRPFKIDRSSEKYISSEFHEKISKSRLAAGDVAVVRTGYPGTAAVIPEDLQVANCADLVVITPGEHLDPHYLTMFLNSSFGRTQVSGKLVGAAQKHFNVGAARKLELPLPSLDIQQSLVKFVNEVDRECETLRDRYQAKAAELQHLTSGILNATFERNA
jgi:type I restriction enzyme S subunit